MKSYLIAAVLFTTVIVRVESAEVNKKTTYHDFEATISLISKSIMDLTDVSVLSTKRDFLLLSDNASECRAMAVQLLKGDVSNQEKHIAIYAMQNLNLDDYLLFLDELLALTRDKKINPDLLERALIPGFEWNTKLQDNWKSPKVRELVENIRVSNLLDDCDQYLDDILSGRGAEYVKRMRQDGEL